MPASPLKTILLIDDDECCRLPAAALLRHADWNVIEASDGESGIAAAIEHRPDAVLCDLMMPRGNGWHVCTALRQHPETRDTKIIIISGRDYPTDRQSVEEAGADDYLVKPLEFESVKRTLARHFPRAAMNGGLAHEREPGKSPGVGTKIKFWGVRGSIPTPGAGTIHYGGNTSCVEVRADGEIIILDAGSGIRLLGDALLAEAGDQPFAATLLITHTHWDHIQGFPFFRPAYNPKARLRIIGVEGARACLASTLAGQMVSPYFPVALQQLPGNIEIEELRELRGTVGAVRIEACQSNHPDTAFGYRLHTSSGSLVYLPDNETASAATSHLPGAEERLERLERLTEFARGADLLICDAQYDAEEYLTHVGWGHGCLDDVVRFAIAAEVGTLYLFHHDPAHDDAKVTAMLHHARKVAKAAGSSLLIEAAREGEQLALVAK